jgi:hypothetical protein
MEIPENPAHAIKNDETIFVGQLEEKRAVEDMCVIKILLKLMFTKLGFRINLGFIYLSID